MRSKAWLPVVAFCALVAAVAAQDPSSSVAGSRPGTARPPRPPFDRDAPIALAGLQAEMLRLQGELVELQDSVLQSAAGRPDRPAKDPRLLRMRLLEQRLEMMRDQSATLVRRLPPAGQMPPGLAQDLMGQKDLLREQMVKIREGFQNIKLRFQGDGGPIDLPEGLDPDPPAITATQPQPTTPAEAGAAVQRGDVKDPQSLIETFMALPDQKLPRSNLGYYKTKHR
jgi:hypothetical protein